MNFIKFYYQNCKGGYLKSVVVFVYKRLCLGEYTQFLVVVSPNSVGGGVLTDEEGLEGCRRKEPLTTLQSTNSGSDTLLCSWYLIALNISIAVLTLLHTATVN